MKRSAEMKKRFFAVCMMLLITTTLIATGVLSANGSSSPCYSDVPESHWAYSAIMEMTRRGLFYGTSVAADGSAVFSPNAEMTRAQFVAVLTRYLYGNELSEMPSAETWYANNYVAALRHGLLTSEEFDNGNLAVSCSRQEMSMLLVRAAYAGAGETIDKLVPISSIPDYSKIDPYYQAYVRQAFSMGFLAGVDRKGTFAPEGYLTRAQAAMVIYRLLDPSARVEARFAEADSFTWENGISYVGEIKNGEANGYGRMVFPDIGSYVGYFVNGKREGLGTFSWLVGDTYVGFWNNDKMTGSGTYTFSDGYVIRGIWQDNRIAADSLSMSPSTIVTTVGAVEQIVAKVEPEQITEVIEWASVGSAISISGKSNLCEITAIAPGNATVIAKTGSGKSTYCEVTVSESFVPLKQIKLNYGDYKANVGDTFQLIADISPLNASDSKITWSSSDIQVASVSDSGYVTVNRPGLAVISAKAESGLIATCYVVVDSPSDTIWNTTWNVYNATASGNKLHTSSVGTCTFSTATMTARLSMQPYAGKYIDLNPINNYSMSGLFETEDEAYELTFTAIRDDLLVLEVKRIRDGNYSDSVDVDYFALER